MVETEFDVADKFASLDTLVRHSGESRNPASPAPAPARPLDPGLRRGDGTPRGEEGRRPDREARRVAAFLTVQEGCDKFCTFCVVPYTRGAEVSRPVEAIVAEAMRLADSGVRELTLLGQNVNAWHGEGPDGRDWGLGRLLFRLAEIPGIDRLRYTTSHPRDMADDLIAAHRDLDALMPYLHLPVQSGSDRILAAMNRRHTAADYLRLVERIRAARPDIALASDYIVGFPGETEDDFAATLRILDEAGHVAAYSFKYSPRPGTPAASAADQVPDAVKSERLQRLQERIVARQAAFLASRVGITADILFERCRPPSRPDRRPLALAPADPCRRRSGADRHHRPRAIESQFRQQPVRHAGRRYRSWRRRSDRASDDSAGGPCSGKLSKAISCLAGSPSQRPLASTTPIGPSSWSRVMSLEILPGKNYSTWSVKRKTLLT